MTVSTDLSALPAWMTLHDSLAELRQRADGFEEFVTERLDRLHELHAGLDQRDRELEVEREALAAERVELEHKWRLLEELRGTAEQGALQVQQEARRLAKGQAELAAAREALAAQQAALSADRAAQSQPADPDQQQAALQAALHDAHQQLAAASVRLVDLAEAQHEAAELRAEVFRLRARLAVAKGRFAPHHPRELERLEAERDRLAEELEATRRRADEHAAREQQRMAEERALWADELGRLRSAVERQARALAAVEHLETVPLGVPECETLTSDPVIDNVLAQFEELEKELTRRPANRQRSKQP